jgi:hypothetical protein
MNVTAKEEDAGRAEDTESLLSSGKEKLHPAKQMQRKLTVIQIRKCLQE